MKPISSIKVRGRWCCLYRAIDCDGNLVDSLLSETRDLKAAQRFLRGARAVVGHAPDRVTTDRHDASPRDSFRPRRTPREAVSLAERRRLFRERWAALLRLIASYFPI